MYTSSIESFVIAFSYIMIFFDKIINIYFYSYIVVRSQVKVQEPVKRNENGTTITWHHLSLNCSGISPQYILNFTNKDLSVYTRNTSNNSYSCRSECINATSFSIWAVVGNENWQRKWYKLEPIGKG